MRQAALKATLPLLALPLPLCQRLMPLPVVLPCQVVLDPVPVTAGGGQRVAAKVVAAAAVDDDFADLDEGDET